MSDLTFIWYPKCSTCKKARAWLDSHGIVYGARDIVADNPTADEVGAWREKSGLALRRFFNTSGMLYREHSIKAALDAGLPDGEAAEILASNGMMVKRPILVGSDFVLVGFREAEWARALGIKA